MESYDFARARATLWIIFLITIMAVGVMVVLALLFSASSDAEAHDRWADDTMVPTWVKSACCGLNDVHHLRPEQVHRVDGGYRIDGYDEMIPTKDVLPSHDGDYWAFYNEHPNCGNLTPCTKAGLSRIYCFFAPLAL